MVSGPKRFRNAEVVKIFVLLPGISRRSSLRARRVSPFASDMASAPIWERSARPVNDARAESARTPLAQQIAARAAGGNAAAVRSAAATATALHVKRASRAAP